MTLSLVILVFVVVIVAIAIAAVVYTVSQHRKETLQAQQRAKDFVTRQASAVWASATIVSVRGGIIGSESGVSSWARCEISLEVTPPGGAPYHTRVTWLVDVAQMSMLQQGAQVSVKIDQQDPKIVYPNASWAKYVPG